MTGMWQLKRDIFNEMSQCKMLHIFRESMPLFKKLFAVSFKDFSVQNFQKEKKKKTTSKRSGQDRYWKERTAKKKKKYWRWKKQQKQVFQLSSLNS